MCDYSLTAYASRPAKVGDKLTVTRFDNSITKGFASVDDCNTAVCVLPGSEIAFDADIVEGNGWNWFSTVHHETKVAKFVQVNMDNPYTHHDALELPTGKTAILSNLKEGQTATVLQIPPAPKTAEEKKAQEHASYV